MIRSQSATVVSRNGPPIPIPALLTTIDGTPCSRSTTRRELLHRRRVGDVDRDACMCAPAGASSTVSFAVSRLSRRRSPPPRARERDRGRAADAAPGARHDREPALERPALRGSARGAARLLWSPLDVLDEFRDEPRDLVRVGALHPMAGADVAAPDSRRPFVRVLEQRRRLVPIVGRDDQLHGRLRRPPVRRARARRHVRAVQREIARASLDERVGRVAGPRRDSFEPAHRLSPRALAAGADTAPGSHGS